MTVHPVAVMVAIAWSTAILILVIPRPDPVRWRLLMASPPRAERALTSRRPWWSIPRLVGGLGGAVRRRLRLRPDEAADRRVGLIGVVVTMMVVAGVPWVVSALVVLVAAVQPVLSKRSARRRRTEAVIEGLPDAVDLMRLAVQAGSNGHWAVALVADRTDGPLGQELRMVCDEVTRGARLADALGRLRSIEPLRPLAEALIDAERYGVALTSGLERLADEARAQRRRRAEERARRLPVTMLFPLVCCILPSFGLLTIVPLIAGTLRSLTI